MADQSDFQQFMERICGQDRHDLARRAIAGVLRHAQDGELPLFAWTLGLPQPALLSMITQCFPELGTLQPMPEREYAAIQHTAPQSFRDLSELLYGYRDQAGDDRFSNWLARTVAAAGFGSRHLWEDLGLPGRDAVSTLMDHYFPSLYRRNVRNLKWKRFLFAEFGAQHGKPDMMPPECGRCDQFPICFPDKESGDSDGQGG